MFKILVTGAKGQLGSDIEEISTNYTYKFYFVDKKILDITDYKKVREFVEKNNINIIINCAAYTAVDKAESEVNLADLINNKAVENLANLAKELSIKLIHISTDYVFDGKNYKPYIESDITNPQSIYGNTKLCGENKIIQINPSNSIIIRTSWVYSQYGNNFVKTMINLSKQKEFLNVINDQVGSPTYARDLADIILQILPNLDNNDVEIYHYSNEGVLSWYDFAKEIIGIIKSPCKINPISSENYKTLAKRPYYSLLDKSKIKSRFNLEIPYWKDSLNKCLEKLGENI